MGGEGGAYFVCRILVRNTSGSLGGGRERDVTIKFTVGNNCE
jgi:hypothetical protein